MDVLRGLGAGAVVVAIVAFVAPACSSSSGTSATFARAEQICESFAPASVSTTLGVPVAAELTSVTWTTAGDITLLAHRTIGHALHPWDQLPSNHFVAQCGYPDTTATTTTISCPSGALPANPDTSQEFYIDEQSRSTPAIPSTSTPPLNVCAYPVEASPTTTSNP